MALSHSWFLEASAPSLASLFASFASLVPCASDNCVAQIASVAMKVKKKIFFIISFGRDVLKQFQVQAANSWPQAELFQVCSGDGASSTSIFGSGSDEAVTPGPGSSTRVIRTARPVL